METNEKTLLERIIEQKTTQITHAIEQAIESGAKVERTISGAFISNILVQRAMPIQDADGAVVIKLKSDLIKQTIGPSREELEKERESLSARIAELNNELNQIKK